MLGELPGGLPWAKRTLGAMVEEQAVLHGDKPFLYFGNSCVSYRELDTNANKVAQGFLRLGVKKGDKVCHMMPNCPDFLVTWIGLAKLGVVEVPVNTALRGYTLEYIINHSEAEVLVVHEDFLEQIAFVQDELPKIRHLVVFGKDGAVTSPKLFVKFEMSPYSELLNNSPEPPEASVEPSDAVTIMFTSGTTGPSKGVVLPHHYCYVTAVAKIKAWKITADDIMYTCLPLFHSNARFSTVITSLVADARVALSTRFSASNFWCEVVECGATEIGCVGTVGNMLLNRPQCPEEHAHRVRMMHGGGSFSPEQRKEFEQRFKLWNPNGFSMTECSVCTSEPLEDSERRKHGTVGRALDEYELKIVDEHDIELPRGQVGELVIRPKYPYSMIMSYWNMPEKTVEAFRNLWFHTGDYLYQDEDGYFYFVGRKKDAIKRRGEMISATEVERVINGHPAIEECAVVGVPSELGDEEVMVFVRAKEGKEVAPEELLAYSESRLAYFMVPRYVEFVRQFAKTETHKIDKKSLRKIGVTTNTWDREKARYVVRRK